MKTFKCGHPATLTNAICRCCTESKNKDEEVRLERDRRYHRQRTFGRGAVLYYEWRLKTQKGLCDICGIKMAKPQQDHDPLCCKYGSCGRCLRSLLCVGCNITLYRPDNGFSSNLNRSLKSKAYIEKWEKIHKTTEFKTMVKSFIGSAKPPSRKTRCTHKITGENVLIKSRGGKIYHICKACSQENRRLTLEKRREKREARRMMWHHRVQRKELSPFEKWKLESL